MSQLTIYLDKQTEDKARRAAKREGMSLSGWARAKLNAAADEGKIWPEGYFELFGIVKDTTFTVPEDLPVDRDNEREPL